MVVCTHPNTAGHLAVALDPNGPSLVEYHAAQINRSRALMREACAARRNGDMAAFVRNAAPDGVHGGISSVLGALADNHTVRNLTLTHAKISHRGAGAVAELLNHNRNLTSLDLSGNILGDAGVTELAAAIANRPAFKALSLAGNGLGDRGVAEIARAVSLINGFESFDISGAVLGGDAADALADLVASSPSLARLGMGGSEIAESASGLISSIGMSRSLESLNLNGAHLADGLGERLGEALSVSPSLSELSIRGSGLGADVAEGLLGSITSGTSRLKHIDLDLSGVGKDVAKRADRALTRARELAGELAKFDFIVGSQACVIQ
jgi:Ran GTPase-activating protein (RanGAP) involved in mRNA processing and transport